MLWQIIFPVTVINCDLCLSFLCFPLFTEFRFPFHQVMRARDDQNWKFHHQISTAFNSSSLFINLWEPWLIIYRPSKVRFTGTYFSQVFVKNLKGVFKLSLGSNLNCICIFWQPWIKIKIKAWKICIRKKIIKND